jgi:hypothetical protein
MRGTATLHDDATLHVESRDDLLIVVWRDAPTGPQMLVFENAAREHARAWPKGTACANLVVSGTPRFSDEVRTAAARMSRDRTLLGLGVAHVVLVGGLRGTAARAFLGGIVLIAGLSRRAHVFGDIDASSAWLAEKLARGAAGGWTGEEVGSVLRTAAVPPP